MPTVPQVPVTPLRRVRRARNLSLEELAVRAKLARTTVYLAERAPALATQRTLERIAEALAVPMEELVGHGSSGTAP